MALNLLIKKFTVDYDTLTFTILDSFWITNSLQNEPIIRKEVEGEEFNFIVPSVQLECDYDTNLANEFLGGQFANYVYAIEIFKDSERRFVGEIEKTSVMYLIDEQTFSFTCRGWLKFFYDVRANQTWSVLHSNLQNFINDFFYVGGGFIESSYFDVDDETATWVTDADINLLLSRDLLSKADFFTEVQKHYGFYVDIDKDYVVRVINRSKRRKDYTPVRIDLPVQIHDQTAERTVIRSNKYDGIIISQKTVLSPILTEISWRYLRMENGVLIVTKILSESQLSTLQTTGRILDLRQKLAAIPSGTYPNVEYSWGYDMGYHVFPMRPYEDTYNDYRDLFESPEILKCDLEYNEDIDLLGIIQYTDDFGGNHWNVVYLEENIERETMSLEATEKFSDTLPRIVDE